jgi:hypothetical protein
MNCRDCDYPEREHCPDCLGCAYAWDGECTTYQCRDGDDWG